MSGTPIVVVVVLIHFCISSLIDVDIPHSRFNVTVVVITPCMAVSGGLGHDAQFTSVGSTCMQLPQPALVKKICPTGRMPRTAHECVTPSVLTDDGRGTGPLW